MFDRVIHTLDRIFERISYVAVYIAGIMTVVMAFLATTGVVKRYILNDPEPYTYELSTIFLVWGVVLTIPYVQHLHRHLRVDFVSSRLPKFGQDILAYLVTPLLALFFLVPMTWKSLENALFSLQISERSATVWAPPMFPLKVLVPIGVGLLCLVLLVQLGHGVSLLIQRKR